MTHRVLALFVLSFLSLPLAASGAVAAGPVPDKNLEAAIRATLHDTKNAPLTETERPRDRRFSN